MHSKDHTKVEDADDIPADMLEEFPDEDDDPISLNQLIHLNLLEMPEDVHVWVMDDYFPETRIWREGEFLVCEIEEHLYTKYWEHKFSAYAFAEAMERATLRLAHEGHPFENPSRDDEDVHIFRTLATKAPAHHSTSICRGVDKVCFRFGVASSGFYFGEF